MRLLDSFKATICLLVAVPRYFTRGKRDTQSIDKQEIEQLKEITSIVLLAVIFSDKIF
jgi:hypothetical protein